MVLCCVSSTSSASSSSCKNCEYAVTQTGAPCTYLVDASLNDESPTSGRHEPLEYLLEVARDLLEGALDGFVLPLVKNLDQLLDRLRRLVEVLAPLDELVALLREVVILFEGLLVDVGELFQAFVDRM